MEATTEITEAPRSELDLEQLLVTTIDTLTLAHPDDMPGDLAEIAEALDGASVETFSATGVMTNNKGVTIRLRNGAEFQLTIVQSGGYDLEDEDEDDECEACGMYIDDCECVGPKDSGDAEVSDEMVREHLDAASAHQPSDRIVCKNTLHLEEPEEVDDGRGHGERDYLTREDGEGGWLEQPVPMRCSDCGRPAYWDGVDYRHALKPEVGCFLIAADPERAEDHDHPLVANGVDAADDPHGSGLVRRFDHP